MEHKKEFWNVNFSHWLCRVYKQRSQMSDVLNLFFMDRKRVLADFRLKLGGICEGGDFGAI